MTHPGPLAPPCRTCLHWKRRYRDEGTCWQETKPDTDVREHDTCPLHTLKVIRPGLPPPPPRHAAGRVMAEDY